MTLLIRKLSSHIKAAILSIHRMFSGSSPSQPIPASVVIPVQAHQIDPARVSRHAAQVTETLTRAGYRAFIVGGAVRDLLLGLTPKDFDVATDATPAQVRKLFRTCAGVASVATSKSFGVNPSSKSRTAPPTIKAR